MAEHQHVARYDPERLRATLGAAGFRVDDAGTIYLASALAAVVLPGSWADLLARREVRRRLRGGAIAWCLAARPDDAD
jgi:hypothetical protein